MAKKKVQAGSSTRLTAKRKDRFLAVLADAGNVSEACRQTGTSRDTVYKIKKKDEAFARRWDSAIEVAADKLEAEVLRRALKGVEVPLHYQGMLTGHTITKYSDALAMFILKGLRPEKYADRQKVESNVKSTNKVIYLPDNGR